MRLMQCFGAPDEELWRALNRQCVCLGTMLHDAYLCKTDLFLYPTSPPSLTDMLRDLFASCLIAGANGRHLANTKQVLEL